MSKDRIGPPAARMARGNVWRMFQPHGSGADNDRGAAELRHDFMPRGQSGERPEAVLEQQAEIILADHAASRWSAAWAALARIGQSVRVQLRISGDSARKSQDEQSANLYRSQSEGETAPEVADSKRICMSKLGCLSPRDQYRTLHGEKS